MIGDYNGSGTLVRRHVPGAGLDEYAGYYLGAGTGSRRFSYYDPLGSAVVFTTEAGSPGVRYAYDEYGMPQAMTGAVFGYAGSLYTPQAGGAPWSMRNRQYHPGLGRFLQTDPIGVGGGVNLYGYVGNDPVNYVDPWGLSRIPLRHGDWIPPDRCRPGGGTLNLEAGYCFIRSRRDTLIRTSGSGGGGSSFGGPDSTYQSGSEVCRTPPPAMESYETPAGSRRLPRQRRGGAVVFAGVTGSAAHGFGLVSERGLYSYVGEGGVTYAGVYQSWGISIGLGGGLATRLGGNRSLRSFFGHGISIDISALIFAFSADFTLENGLVGGAYGHGVGGGVGGASLYSYPDSNVWVSECP